MEKSNTRLTSQTMVPATIPCMPTGTVLCNRPNTNSIVGADISLYSIVGAINSHTVRSPTCPWASIVLWAPGFTIPGEHGETRHMPLGIKQYLQVPTSTIPEEDNATSHMHLTFYSDCNSIVDAYNHLVPAGVGNKA